MTNPYFWAKREDQATIKDITTFSTANSLQKDPNGPPHTIKKLKAGKYDLYISDGSSGEKRGPSTHLHLSNFETELLDQFSPVVAASINYLDGKLVLQAKDTGGNTQDFTIYEIRDDDLEQFDSTVTVSKLYDKSGNNNDLIPSSTGPEIVQSGSTARSSEQKAVANYTNAGKTTLSLPDKTKWTVVLQIEPAGTSEKIGDIDGVEIRDTGSAIRFESPGKSWDSVQLSQTSVDFFIRWSFVKNGKYYVGDSSDVVVHDLETDTATQKSTSNATPFSDIYDVYRMRSDDAHVLNTGDGIEYWYDDGTIDTYTPNMGISGFDGKYIYDEGGSLERFYMGNKKTANIPFTVREFLGVTYTDGIVWVLNNEYKDDEWVLEAYDGHNWGNGWVQDDRYEYSDTLDGNDFRVGIDAIYINGEYGTEKITDIGSYPENAQYLIKNDMTHERMFNRDNTAFWTRQNGWESVSQLYATAGSAENPNNDLFYSYASDVDVYQNGYVKDVLDVPYQSGQINNVVVSFDGTKMAINVNGTDKSKLKKISRTSSDVFEISDAFTGKLHSIAVMPSYLSASRRNNIATSLLR